MVHDDYGLPGYETELEAAGADGAVRIPRAVITRYPVQAPATPLAADAVGAPYAQVALEKREMTGLWLDAAEFVEGEGMKEMLEALFQAGITPPEVGYEVASGKRVVGTVELGWPEPRVAVVTGKQLTRDGDAFRSAGWTLFSFPFDVKRLLEALR